MRLLAALILILALTSPSYSADTVVVDRDGVTTSAPLSTAGRTGDYNDLANKPTIPAAQVAADWDASSGVAAILNKPLSVKDFVTVYGGVVVFRGDAPVCDTLHAGHAAAVSALAAAGIDSDHIMCQDGFAPINSFTATLTGASASASAGDIGGSAGATAVLTGADSTASAGTLTALAAGDAAATLSGAAMIVYAGDMSVAADGAITLSGVTVTASAAAITASAGGDTTAPTVVVFNAGTPVGQTVPIAEGDFSATDDVGVTGYIITESSTPPDAGAAGWSGTPPTSYQAQTVGTLVTLYAWAKDAAGNVSTAAYDYVDTSSGTASLSGATAIAAAGTLTISADGMITLAGVAGTAEAGDITATVPGETVTITANSGDTVTTMVQLLAFSGARGSTAANVPPDNASTSLFVSAEHSVNVDDDDEYVVARSYLDFDIPQGAAYTSAELQLYVESLYDATKQPKVSVQASTHSNPVIAGDFDAFPGAPDGTSFGQTAAITTTGTTYTITLNASGLTYLNGIRTTGGTAKFMLREYDHDFLNVAPSDAVYLPNFSSTRHATASQRPKLVVQ